MKKILCYGDSNTFGFNPSNGLRFDENTRWTSLLKKNLNNEYDIIEEGMCDRTGFVNNPKGLLFSAQRHFPKLLSQLEKPDIIIIAIGTNDLQFQYNIDFITVEKGLTKLINKSKEITDKIIIIPPVILKENILNGYFKIQFDKTSIIKSKEIGTIYKKLSTEMDCFYFDINKIAVPSDIDGLHYGKMSHKKIAFELAEFIKNSFL